VANHIITPKTGALTVGSHPVNLRVLQDLVLDSNGAFYHFVLTYLVASAGLTPVYDANNYPAFMSGVAGVFPGKASVDARADLAECVKLARDGTLPQPQAEISLCCMLANSAYESVEKRHKDRLKGNPVFEFFRHTRNAASHRNAWHFSPREPSARAEWHRIIIDDSRKGNLNPLQNVSCFYGTLQPADLLYLLRDVERLLI
jgi:hypothetical protein